MGHFGLNFGPPTSTPTPIAVILTSVVGATSGTPAGLPLPAVMNGPDFLGNFCSAELDLPADVYTLGYQVFLLRPRAAVADSAIGSVTYVVRDIEVPVDQNFGQQGAFTAEINGVPTAGVTITAYLASDYATNPTTAVARGSTVSNADGSWAEPLSLGPGDYTLLFTAPTGEKTTAFFSVF